MNAAAPAMDDGDVVAPRGFQGVGPRLGVEALSLQGRTRPIARFTKAIDRTAELSLDAPHALAGIIGDQQTNLDEAGVDIDAQSPGAPAGRVENVLSPLVVEGIERI